MKSLAIYCMLGLSLAAPGSRADTMHPFVRVACVPANGLLDIDTAGLHDSVAAARGGSVIQARKSLAQAGFHAPDGLRLSCDLDGAHYLITATQGAVSNKLCGASPEITLSLTRNGKPVLKDVTFGASCLRRAALTRITIGDGRQSWRGRESQACFAPAEAPDMRHCEWTFGDDQFAKQYPLDGAAIDKLTARFRQP